LAETSGGKRALVLFGGGGDLAQRMLFPSLCFLEADGLLPAGLSVLATGRHDRPTETFREELRQTIARRSGDDFNPNACNQLLQRLEYMPADAKDPASLKALGDRIKALGATEITYYLATSPSLYGSICEGLKAAGLTGPGTRVVLEKPIGKDLASSRLINEAVCQAFTEDRVFRIDHYLGKETVQNLLALRFANTLFEPLWNNLTIDHVQITVGETGGVGDRWGYYDEYGAMGDMVQNHMMQLLCLVAMEPPSDLEPDSVRNEKVKVMRSLRPITREHVATDMVRGQYVKGVGEDGQPARSYEEERGAPSETETFVALKAQIDNWRWAGVPFFLRTGKRLPSRSTEIFIQFKPVPHSIFTGESKADLIANQLLIRLQPEEDIILRLMNKAPGLSLDGMRLESLPLSLSLGGKDKAGKPLRRRIAYERLLLDAMNGNPTLFVRRDEVEKAWEWVDAANDAWRRSGQSPKPYTAGTWGPAGAFALIEREGRTWHE
jgi:glucose-6-phosphate 1-dehydrogenase